VDSWKACPSRSIRNPPKVWSCNMFAPNSISLLSFASAPLLRTIQIAQAADLAAVMQVMRGHY
jgi:hypothetical protein